MWEGAEGGLQEGFGECYVLVRWAVGCLGCGDSVCAMRGGLVNGVEELLSFVAFCDTLHEGVAVNGWWLRFKVEGVGLEAAGDRRVVTEVMVAHVLDVATSAGVSDGGVGMVGLVEGLGDKYVINVAGGTQVAVVRVGGCVMWW